MSHRTRPLYIVSVEISCSEMQTNHTNHQKKIPFHIQHEQQRQGIKLNGRRRLESSTRNSRKTENESGKLLKLLMTYRKPKWMLIVLNVWERFQVDPMLQWRVEFIKRTILIPLLSSYIGRRKMKGSEWIFKSSAAGWWKWKWISLEDLITWNQLGESTSGKRDI